MALTRLEKNLVAQEASEHHVQLVLLSGQILKVRGIELYPAEELAKIAAMRAEAMQKLGGVSTGVGFIGSPGWVIGASAALGFLESALSDSIKKAALRQLAQAEELSATARSLGQLFQIKSIKQIERPNPGSWTAHTVESKRVLHKVTLFGKENYRDIDITTTFVHNGDDFLGVETENSFVNVRWSSVVGYVAPSLPDKAEQSPPPLPLP
jgi:hypothetical protein